MIRIKLKSIFFKLLIDFTKMFQSEDEQLRKIRRKVLRLENSLAYFSIGKEHAATCKQHSADQTLARFL